VLWGAPLPVKPGQGAEQLLAARGREPCAPCGFADTTRSWRLLQDATAVLRQLDLVIVQHPFLTETAKYAHVVLPVAAFGEERVTFTNTERRIQLVGKAVDTPPGLAPAWRQIVRMANRLGAGWDYVSAADVMREIGRAVPFYGAATYDNLARDYGRQWPCGTDKPLGTRFL